MKRAGRRPFHGKRRREEGSVTLEAALVMPVFLLFVLFLVFLIQASVTTMALHGTLSQTVRQAASMWYPVSMAEESFSKTDAGQAVERINQKLADIQDFLRDHADFLPSPLSEWASEAASRSWSLEENAAIPLFETLAGEVADRRALDMNRFSIVSVELPGSTDSDSYLTVEAEYRLPMKVPFVGRSLVLRSSARERAWIGGSPSTALLESGEEGNSIPLSFVSMEPSPARPGRRVTLTLKTVPGETVDLSVFYKSGESAAKHLGQATADSDGLVSWTWLVSGNTTSGTWNWEAKTSDGSAWNQSFLVSRS
ncbi:TadE/TadG family type IV pilus assembly protein [Cohnella sp. AR92]|uniref:TadE/TadG family type IV pilus assembly protein n=1 Tax=Cohnella sp. AR92 TaxID=648716 RepID=UPI0013151A4A|nr:TadE/TadG family type IV pilus assembly protein [Cohnella sp. AR92]